MSDLILRRLPLLAAVLLLAWLPLARTQDTLTGRELVREPVTVFAVRHAEKGADYPRDPGLTSSGETRVADLLRGRLDDSGARSRSLRETLHSGETGQELSEEAKERLRERGYLGVK